jgi:hypothetical protein
VPALLGVLDRVGELQRTAAVVPPDPDRVRGLDAPIPTIWTRPGLSADTAVVDATAALAAEFRRRDRPTATVRELVAVCHVASHVAEHFSAGGDNSGEATVLWVRARDTLTQYSDGIPLPPPGQPRSNLLQQAMRVESNLQRVERLELSPALSPGHRDNDASNALRHLRRLANACSAEVGRIRPTLVVLPGRTPISDERTGEWLRREPFRATPPDLAPALTVLHDAATTTVVGPAMARVVEL